MRARLGLTRAERGRCMPPLSLLLLLLLHGRSQAASALARVPPSPAPAPGPAGAQFGLGPAYTAIKLLGRGGTGQTWLCREAASDRLFAVKLQQRPIPRGTVRLTYNEITVSGLGGLRAQQQARLPAAGCAACVGVRLLPPPALNPARCSHLSPAIPTHRRLNGAQIQASTCVSSVHHSHIHEVVLTPSHLALVLQNEAGGSAAEFVAQQARPRRAALRRAALAGGPRAGRLGGRAHAGSRGGLFCAWLSALLIRRSVEPSLHLPHNTRLPFFPPGPRRSHASRASTWWSARQAQRLSPSAAAAGPGWFCRCCSPAAARLCIDRRRRRLACHRPAPLPPGLPPACRTTRASCFGSWWRGCSTCTPTTWPTGARASFVCTAALHRVACCAAGGAPAAPYEPAIRHPPTARSPCITDL